VLTTFGTDLILVFLTPVIFARLSFGYLAAIPELPTWSVVVAALITATLMVVGWLTALLVRPFGGL
jgi:hypothetical protein